MMLKILICYGLINIINALDPQQSPYIYGKIPKDVEVFGSLYPGAVVPKPKPLPPRKPARTTTTTTPSPTYSTSEPFRPTFHSKKPPTSTKKTRNTTSFPSFYPWTTKKPISFPPPIYPSLAPNNTPSFTSTAQPFYTFTTPKSTVLYTKWPEYSTKSLFFPTSSYSTQSTTWQPKYPSTVASGTTGTPPWIYPPRPSWPKRRPSHLISTNNKQVTESTNAEESGHFLTGSISEYQPYNEEDGSFKLGFELRNGLSAKVHGYKKNNKLVLEGSYSIFTKDGKPVNIVYKADENNYQDSEPTIFHLEIPSFDQLNLDDENEDMNLVPTYVPYHSNSSKILNIDQSDDDEQFSDLILEPTTQESDAEISSAT